MGNKLKKLFLVLLITVLTSCCMHGLGRANDLSGRLGVGLGNPYVALKYGFNPKISGELRAAFGEGIAVYGVRGYYNFNPQNTSVLFLGLEGDRVTFDNENIAGTGTVLMFFVGFEHFITKNLSFNADIGPAYITLSTDRLGSQGIEWVFNVGVNFYFQ